MPFCVATVTSNSVDNRSGADMMYSNVASYTGLQLSLMTIVLRFVSFDRPGSKYSLTYGSGMLDASFIGILLKGKNTFEHKSSFAKIEKVHAVLEFYSRNLMDDDG